MNQDTQDAIAYHASMSGMLFLVSPFKELYVLFQISFNAELQAKSPSNNENDTSAPRDIDDDEVNER